MVSLAEVIGLWNTIENRLDKTILQPHVLPKLSVFNHIQRQGLCPCVTNLSAPSFFPKRWMYSDASFPETSTLARYAMPHRENYRNTLTRYDDQEDECNGDLPEDDPVLPPINRGDSRRWPSIYLFHLAMSSGQKGPIGRGQ
jgi:hypothetical protein